MRKIVEKVSASVAATVAVTLDHQARQKSRGLLRLDDGSEAALLLERGSNLQHGDRLRAEDGVVVQVQAALEGLSIVTASDPLELARAAYHLGNRHIAVQIGALRLAYLHDHVLDDMVRELGFQVAFAAEPFEPESGAYGHGHAHLSNPHGHGHARISHAHGTDHDHHHEHEHPPISLRRAQARS
ncbi:MAG: urease accessory protein UreE [Myxococcales bacterium]|jgi:urease accessory protein